MLYKFADIVVGLVMPTDRVTEDSGPLLICAAIEVGELERDLVVMMTVELDTASPDDLDMELQPFYFSEESAEVCRNVSISDDSLFEEDETFFIDLLSVEEDSAVSFTTSRGMFTILNDDGTCTGIL